MRSVALDMLGEHGIERASVDPFAIADAHRRSVERRARGFVLGMPSPGRCFLRNPLLDGHPIFGRNRPLGGFLYDRFGLSVAFTWRAVVLASAVVAFPLLVRTVRTSFEEIDPRLEAIARTLGRGRLGVFFTVSLPLASRGILAGLILAFSRALGEFGATIMVAGNIPEETQTLSLAIFQLVQLGRDPDAYRLAAVTVLVALVAIWLADRLSRRPRSKSVALR
ncbi:MAG TPA: ABC transporter permease subunit [Vicinamibacteria bacterium]|nr:ABC transporter permease subunit [Vicinamibacteria bacterium]